MLKKILLLLLICSCAGHAMAQDEQAAKLKAVFIYNFTRYIAWDNNNDGSDFVIGIVGNSPITGHLQEIAKVNQVGNRKMLVRIFNRPEDISPCDLLFIPAKNSFPLQSILDRAGKGVLTVSEEPGYAKKGTAFNFIIVDDKLKFEANLRALEIAGLKAGSQLLKLAIIVD